MPHKINARLGSDNRHSLQLSVLLLTVGLTACAHQLGGRLLQEEHTAVTFKETDFALYDTAGNAYALRDLEQAMNAAMALRPASQQLTLFVHGMGPYPQKAYKDHELQGIADTFDSAVLMLHWPSWKGSWLRLSRQSALASGRALQAFWQQLQTLRDAGQAEDKRWILLAHSMGTEVMRAVSEKPHAQVFDSVLIAAPETELAAHARWLSKLQLGKRTAVLINPQDTVLGFAKVSAGNARLGLGLESGNDAAIELAPGVSYLVVQNNNHSHKLHYKNQPAALKHLLQQLINPGQLDELCNSQPSDTVVVVLDKKVNNIPYCQQHFSY